LSGRLILLILSYLHLKIKFRLCVSGVGSFITIDEQLQENSGCYFPHTVFAYWELFYSSDLVYPFPYTSESSAVVEVFSVMVMDGSGKL